MMKTALPLAFAALICTHLPARSQTDGAVVTLQNPGLEEPYSLVPTPGPEKKAQISGTMADGWSDNSDWANIGVEYAPDTDNPHGGSASQRVTISRVTEGAVQITQKVEFQANHQYIFRVWMRGTPGATVSVQLRQAQDPYTTYAMTSAKLSDEWQEFSVSGGVPDDTKGFLLLLAGQPITFWVDDVQFEDLTK